MVNTFYSYTQQARTKKDSHAHAMLCGLVAKRPPVHRGFFSNFEQLMTEQGTIFEHGIQF